VIRTIPVARPATSSREFVDSLKKVEWQQEQKERSFDPGAASVDLSALWNLGSIDIAVFLPPEASIFSPREDQQVVTYLQ
jgi:hypothetical protein